MRPKIALQVLITLAFTILGLAVMGYHPGYEDDGVYLAAVKHNLNPALYPHDSSFFTVQLQATVFDKLLAGFVRGTGIPLAWASLLWQVVAVAAILFACRSIAGRLFAEARAQWAGVALVSAMFTLPVSGTALYLVDQHLHPRTLATACILLAVDRVLAGRRLAPGLLLAAAFAVHPLMAAFGISFCAILAVALRVSWPVKVSFGGSAAAFLPLGWVLAPPSPSWHRALETRGFYSVFAWQWYEWLGAVAPLVLFWLLWRVARRRDKGPLGRFALAVAVYGGLHLALAMVVAGSPVLVRALPLQPMRFLHLVYFFMALVGGGLLGRFVLKASVWRWSVYLLAINGGMLYAQLALFDGTEHLEWPGRASTNPWVQAFLWVQQNTPADAYFALDPEYLAAPGEDFHSFRALAERSALADGIKDAAVVTQVPELGAAWERQVSAQAGWGQFGASEFQRLNREFGVSWVVAGFPAPAGVACRWHNNTVSVCELQ